MEKYSKHLEALVGERTQELIIEQKKTQQLLYSMLPQAVADELRQGRPASAKQYSSVTIYFRYTCIHVHVLLIAMYMYINSNAMYVHIHVLLR